MQFRTGLMEQQQSINIMKLFEESEQTISDNEKSISNYNSEIETNKKKIEELVKNFKATVQLQKLKN